VPDVAGCIVPGEAEEHLELAGVDLPKGPDGIGSHM
jgi:hypothetical protein